MSDPATILDPSRVELDLDEGAFPRDAVYGAAYTFIDRCYVRLHRAAEGRIGIVLRAKTRGSLDAEAVAAELQGELFAQAFRLRLDGGGPRSHRVDLRRRPRRDRRSPGVSTIPLRPRRSR